MSKQRSLRRDRRKAKMSGWRRAPKTSMSAGRVGHGPNGSVGGIDVRFRVIKAVLRRMKKGDPMPEPIGERLNIPYSSEIPEGR